VPSHLFVHQQRQKAQPALVPHPDVAGTVPDVRFYNVDISGQGALEEPLGVAIGVGDADWADGFSHAPGRRS